MCVCVCNKLEHRHLMCQSTTTNRREIKRRKKKHLQDIEIKMARNKFNNNAETRKYAREF